MQSIQTAIAATLLAVTVAAVAKAEETSSPANPFQCPVTLKEGGVLQNDALLVTLPPKFVFQPGGPGFVDFDGALGMKVGWSRKRKGQLEIGGMRLDEVGPPARAYIY